MPHSSSHSGSSSSGEGEETLEAWVRYVETNLPVFNWQGNIEVGLAGVNALLRAVVLTRATKWLISNSPSLCAVACGQKVRSQPEYPWVQVSGRKSEPKAWDRFLDQ